MAELVGVDIGTSAVRVASVAGVDNRGMAIVTRLGISPMPEGAIVGGRIRSPQDVSIAMIRALKEANCKKYGFILGIESPDVAISSILLPATLNVEERGMTIKTMGKSVSPTFPIEDSCVSTHLKERIDRQGVAMVSVNVLRSVRTISGAGAEITRSIMQATGTDFKKAEELKMTTKLVRQGGSRGGNSYRMDESYEQDDISPAERALSNAVDLLVDTIALAIEADAAQHGSISQGIVLTGGTSLLRGFKERLTSRVGIPATIGRPWADIERSRRNALLFKEGNIHPALLMSIGLASGLALWKEPR